MYLFLTIARCFGRGLSRNWWLIVWGCLAGQPGFAEQGLCRAPEQFLPQDSVAAETTEITDAAEVRADRAWMEESGDTAVFNGSVNIRRGENSLRADELVYHPETGDMEARGGVTLWDPRFVIRGERAQLNADDSGGIDNAHYWLRERRGYGQAERMLRYDEGHTVLLKGEYSTCDPDNQTWRLDARETRLDFTTDTGVSKGVVLRIHDWPVLYTPYINYPLGDKPKSGLLVPRGGYSGLHGLDVSIPYYWHAATNYDFTFTPRWMEKRGLLLGTEFRYLTARANGQWNVEYLPGDQVYDADRSFVQVSHGTAFSPVLSTQVLYQEASDPDYFKHFGSSLDLAGTVYLPRQATLNYLLPNYYLFQGYVLDYQSLQAPGLPKPYRIAPALSLAPLLPARNRHFNVRWQNEVKRFKLTDQTQRAEGVRFYSAPSLVYPLRFAAGFVEPALNFNYIYYALEDGQTQASGKNTLDHFAHSVSIDSGLFFERELTWRNQTLLQTLEPRLFYQYSPQRTQDDYPIFDTARYDLSWSQLFRVNPFSGPDRLSDRHALSAALSTRTLRREDGRELLQMGIGRRFDFRDSQIILPGETLKQVNASPYVGEVALWPNANLRLSHTHHWDPDNDPNSPYSAWSIRYHLNAERMVNFSYRQRNDAHLLMEQTDLSWHWPLNAHWRTLGRWNYSLEHHANLEILSGIEYESCCWAVRLVARRYLQDLALDDYETSFHFQIQLKGLGGLGNNTFLRERIPGFGEDL